MIRFFKHLTESFKTDVSKANKKSLKTMFLVMWLKIS